MCSAASNKAMKNLDLRRNFLSEHATAAVVAALPSCDGLDVLDISDMPLLDKQVSVLLRILQADLSVAIF